MPREKSPTTPAAPRKSAARKTLSRRKPEIASVTPFVDPGQRAALIAEAAYYRAERRGFTPGHEAEDWLAAEAEIDAALLRESPAPNV